ncbi:MAG: type IV pili methyl-accepting chemotaxis transducer N-terminal domain-containing protein [Acidobacteria bacterium]|nr:type IV pili methyl-accepting chemotaxis transducer N-terminal domain-containing protein [Acidobacteriota bacterium]
MALRASAGRFQRALTGLIRGDAELGLSACQDAAIRQRLDKVEALWRPFSEALSSLAAGTAGDGSSLRHIKPQRTPTGGGECGSGPVGGVVFRSIEAHALRPGRRLRDSHWAAVVGLAPGGGSARQTDDSSH